MALTSTQIIKQLKDIRRNVGLPDGADHAKTALVICIMTILKAYQTGNIVPFADLVIMAGEHLGIINHETQVALEIVEILKQVFAQKED